MLWITAVVLVLLFAGPAKAAPVTLSCDGEISKLSSDDQRHARYAMTITMDLQAKTATITIDTAKIENYEASIVQLAEPNLIAIVGDPQSKQEVGGEVNRATGSTLINFYTEHGSFEFSGICTSKKPLYTPSISIDCTALYQTAPTSDRIIPNLLFSNSSPSMT
jgi:hypothetical protein